MIKSEGSIFWRHWGPRVTYENGALIIEDLNPETKLTWVLAPDELADLGHACILKAAEFQEASKKS